MDTVSWSGYKSVWKSDESESGIKGNFWSQPASRVTESICWVGGQGQGHNSNHPTFCFFHSASQPNQYNSTQLTQGEGVLWGCSLNVFVFVVFVVFVILVVFVIVIVIVFVFFFVFVIDLLGQLSLFITLITSKAVWGQLKMAKH